MDFREMACISASERLPIPGTSRSITNLGMNNHLFDLSREACRRRKGFSVQSII
jgi:hypothetical protein